MPDPAPLESLKLQYIEVFAATRSFKASANRAKGFSPSDRLPTVRWEMAKDREASQRRTKFQPA
jgi:hypothetical protein